MGGYNPCMRLLGLDFGTKRIGVALSDEMGWTAQGLTTIERRGNNRDLGRIGQLVEEHSVEWIVLGLPLNMDGSEGKAAGAVRKFAVLLEERLGLPVHLWDERLTSWEAEGILKEAEVKPKKRKQVVDKLAATLILKGYLDAQRESAD
jgi:putative Holliday junction resolvase